MNLEHQVTLKQGDYWRARRDIPQEGIKRGEVLLLQSIRDVEKSAHTIILRPHPKHADKYIEAIDEDGDRQSFDGDDHEHRFLTDDFVAWFEPAPDYAEIRAAEIADIQSRVVKLQKELIDGASDTSHATIAGHLKAGLRTWEKEKKLLKGTAAALPQPQPFDDSIIGPSLTTKDIDTFRLVAEKGQQLAKLHGEWIAEKSKEIASTLKELAPFFMERAAAALARTEDTQRYVERLLTSVESLDLYLGKNVEVVTIATGESADQLIPLTIMQMKLFMNEELSVWADVDETFDFEKDTLFFEHLAKEPSLVKQIFATERCMVCMATRRFDRHYDNGYESAQKNKINREVFLLVRDGANLHAVYSPIGSHKNSRRLFPSQAEIDAIYREGTENKRRFGERESDARRITFADVRYTDALEEHEDLAMHYKRFLILLAGLDHKRNLFGTFYSGPKDMSFMTLGFQEDHLRFIHDDETETQLPSDLLASERTERFFAEAFSTSAGLAPLRLVVTGKNNFTLYCAPRSEEMDNRLFPHVWVHAIRLTRKANGFVEDQRRWKILPDDPVTETILVEWDAAKPWIGAEPIFRSFEEKQKVFATAAEFNLEKLPDLFQPKIEDPQVWHSRFEEWKTYRQIIMNRRRDGDRKVHEPALVIPFGVVKTRYGIRYLSLVVPQAAYALYWTAPNKDCRDTIIKGYSSIYRDSASATGRVVETKREIDIWAVDIDTEIRPSCLADPKHWTNYRTDLKTASMLPSKLKALAAEIKSEHEFMCQSVEPGRDVLPAEPEPEEIDE